MVRSDHVSPGLLRILGLHDTPAQVTNSVGDTLLQTPPAVALSRAADIIAALLVFTAIPGTDSYEKLQLLTVIGTHTIDTH